jgi:diguanylate cyclase (GGDEF)-like protein
MIRCVADIMIRDFPVVDSLAGLRHVQNRAVENEFGSLVVMESNKVVGVLNYWDLVKSHPNRIVADAMSEKFMYIAPEMTVWEAKEMFDEHCVELLLIGNQKAVCGMVNKPLIDAEIGQHCDLLTGLYRSDYIYYQAIKLLHDGSAISFIFLDVNNFGRIDKEYGHIHGDKILQEISALLKSKMNEQTYLSRFGGDEFLVLTPYNVDECCSFAENLLHSVVCHHFYKDIPVTISAGIARKSDEGNLEDPFSSLLQMVNRASLASTKAKKNKSELVVADDIDFNEDLGRMSS